MIHKNWKEYKINEGGGGGGGGGGKPNSMGGRVSLFHLDPSSLVFLNSSKF